MKKTISLFFVFFGLLFVCSAQDIKGDWSGELNLGNQKLRAIFHINASDSGYTATMDSPDQGAMGLPAKTVEYNHPNLTIQFPALNAVYTGAVSDTLIIGSLVQNGFPMALNLRRGGVVVLRRPQNPQQPYPYRSEDVTIPNEDGSIVLAGTLTIPEGKGPFPAVVLVTGSGPQNRNEEIMGHKPFLVLSDYLTRKGIAVLRYDDRGFGQSTGNFARSTSEDFTVDALRAAAWLRKRDEVQAKKVGIIGHSEGGTVAFMAAAESKDVAFIVSMAGCAAKGDSLLLTQNRALLIAAGAPTNFVDSYVEVLRQIFRIHKHHSAEYIKENLDSLQRELFPSNMPKPFRDNALVILKTPVESWMRYFRQNDPQGYIVETRCPVLALNGDLDLQVDAGINLGLIREYSKESGNKSVTIKQYEGLNHLFQTAKTGQMVEYGQIEETLSPQVLEDIAAWILSLPR